MLIPRAVVFDSKGKALCAGNPCNGYSHRTDCRHTTMHLPSEHFDFIDVNVEGKTEAEIMYEITAEYHI
jgi:hypothetical protein